MSWLEIYIGKHGFPGIVRAVCTRFVPVSRMLINPFWRVLQYPFCIRFVCLKLCIITSNSDRKCILNTVTFVYVNQTVDHHAQHKVTHLED